MSTARMVAHEFRFDRRSLVRDPQALFAILALPLLYVVIFVTLFGNQKIEYAIAGQPGPLLAKTPMLAGFISVGIVSATFFQVMSSLVHERESGVLKRLRSTPLQPIAFIGGQVATMSFAAIGIVGLLVVFGRGVYGVAIPLAGIPALALCVLVAAPAFCCMGIAFTRLVHKDGAAMPVGMGVTLAVFFLSGNFFQIRHWPPGIRIPAEVLPVKHLNDALMTALNPNVTGLHLDLADLGLVAGWGVICLFFARRWFSWTPSAE